MTFEDTFETEKEFLCNLTPSTPLKKDVCKVLSSKEVMQKQFEFSKDLPVKALYSSLYEGIILDSTYMFIPFVDHMVHRGHAVFDTCTLINSRLYRLDAHLKRFRQSSQFAKLTNPFESDEEIKNIIMRTCSASQCRAASVRFWLSAGGNDFSIWPGVTTFWVAVIQTGPMVEELEGLKEVTVLPSIIPMKPPMLAKAKTTNYLINCLLSLYARHFGGKYGIWIDSDGNVAEGSIAGIIIVTDQKTIVVPPTDYILQSVTVLRACEIISQALKKKNTHSIFSKIERLEQRKISHYELMQAHEVIFLSGDIFVEPVVQINGFLIGEQKGLIGPVARWLNQELKHEACYGNQCIDTIEYKEQK